MTAEQKSKLGQGIFFGLLFLYLGYFMKGCGPEYDSVRYGGRFGMVMGVVIVAWGAWQALSKPK